MWGVPQIPAQPKSKLLDLIPWLFAFCWRHESQCFLPGVSVLRTVIPVDFFSNRAYHCIVTKS